MSPNDRKRRNNDSVRLAKDNNKKARCCPPSSSSSSTCTDLVSAYHALLGGAGFKACAYCYNVSVPIDEGITFDCNHFACNHCASNYIISIINSSSDDEVLSSNTTDLAEDGYAICPAKGCSRKITLDQARYIILELGDNNNDDNNPQTLWRKFLLMMLSQLDGSSTSSTSSEVVSVDRGGGGGPPPLPPASTQVTVSSSNGDDDDDDVIDLDDDDCIDEDDDTRKNKKLINKIKEEIQLATLATEGNNKSYPNSKRDCPLCLEKDIPLEDGVRLSCDHFMCITCAREYIKSRIMDGQVRDDEFICPMPKCNISIGVQQAEYIIMDSTAAVAAAGGGAGAASSFEDDDAKAIWEKFLDFRFKHVFQTSDKKDGDFIECPHLGCEYAFLVEDKNDMDSSCKCPLCQKSFCPKCYFIDGHKGKSCEAVEGELKEEETTDALAKDKGWRKCPVCGVIVSKEHGCNFMWCSSPQCRNKTNFCYVCGDKLTRDQHYSHFPKGPFENCCDKADLRQQQGEKKEANKQPAKRVGKNNRAGQVLQGPAAAAAAMQQQAMIAGNGRVMAQAVANENEGVNGCRGRGGGGGKYVRRRKIPK